MKLDNPLVVQWEYASEERLAKRNQTYRELTEGVNPDDAVFEAVREAAPERFLDVGCGMGELAERVQKELGAQVVAVDISPRMVELTRARGIDVHLADVQSLPFADGEFDCVAANWVLYHVPDLDRGLSELERVIRRGGRLVAATLGAANMQELWDLLGGEVTAGLSFGYENGERALAPYFTQIERREANGTVVFPDRSSMVDFVAATTTRSHLADLVPELTEPFQHALDPLRLRGRQVVIRPAELIERKRNGEELSAEEISELILGYARGEIPDYQLAAFCMAVYFRGMTAAETYALTDAMIRSGRTLDLGTALGRKVVDKHSTGGVGDKTTIAVGPIVAACGVPVGKMSGRGLGHTGGTLDKLESIPGFDVELSVDQFVTQVKTVGLAIVGQTDDLVPADKQLYALRDVTATVDILPLIASSIMSKKIAGGADAIVLDVKVGDGAFMKTLDDARALAETMLELGRHAGREVVCLLTDMDQPLGAAVGNSLEIAEARDTVRGEGPPDFTELVLDACARLLSLSDLGVNVEEGQAGSRGRGRGRLGAGRLRALDPGAGRRPRPGRVAAGAVRPAGERAPRGLGHETGCDRASGWLRSISAPGGRTKEDEIDHAVGVVCHVKRGASVEQGALLADVHARDEASGAEAVEAVLAAYELGDDPPDGALDPARRRCLSYPRSRPSGERSRRHSRAGGSSTSRSATSG